MAPGLPWRYLLAQEDIAMRLLTAAVALIAAAAMLEGTMAGDRGYGIDPRMSPPGRPWTAPQADREAPPIPRPRPKGVLSEDEKQALREWVEKDMTPEARRSWEEAERDPEKALEKDARAAKEREAQREMLRRIEEALERRSGADI